MADKKEPTLLRMENGDLQLVISVSDFSYLIDKYMGADASFYYYQQITRLLDVVRKLNEEVSEYYDNSEAEEVLKEYDWK